MKDRVLSVLQRLHTDESGQNLTEYALVAAMMALGSIATMGTLASNLNRAFSNMGSTLNSASK